MVYRGIFCIALFFALASCNDTYSKNKSAVEEAVNLREASGKKDLKSVEITGHLISGTGIIVYVSGVAAGNKFTDTLSFETTGDGYLINSN
jgi:hypothetical protein